jgi:hypothetical protein
LASTVAADAETHAQVWAAVSRAAALVPGAAVVDGAAAARLSEDDARAVLLVAHHWTSLVDSVPPDGIAALGAALWAARAALPWTAVLPHTARACPAVLVVLARASVRGGAPVAFAPGHLWLLAVVALADAAGWALEWADVAAASVRIRGPGVSLSVHVAPVASDLGAHTEAAAGAVMRTGLQRLADGAEADAAAVTSALLSIAPACFAATPSLVAECAAAPPHAAALRAAAAVVAACAPAPATAVAAWLRARTERAASPDAAQLADALAAAVHALGGAAPDAGARAALQAVIPAETGPGLWLWTRALRCTPAAPTWAPSAGVASVARLFAPCT